MALIKRYWSLLLWIIITVFISLQGYYHARFEYQGRMYTHYENYIIFKCSASHLWHGLSLYAPYMKEHWDLYKYGPTFAFLMTPFSWLQNMWGLLFWNLLNTLVLWFGIWKWKDLFTGKKIIWVWLLILPELIVQLQNEQSNALLAGLILLSWFWAKNNKIVLSCLLICIGIFIKPFLIAGLAVFPWVENKIKYVIWIIIWMIVLALAPALAVGISNLPGLYQDWMQALDNDKGIPIGLSWMHMLKHWLYFLPITIRQLQIMAVLVPGVIALRLLQLKFPKAKELLVFGFIFLWMVAFNHRTESPGMIIGVVGLTMLWAIKPHWIWIFAIVWTDLAATDLIPKFVRTEWIVPFGLKGWAINVLLFYAVYLILEQRSDKNNITSS